MGLNYPINYCAFLLGDYAVFGVYALNYTNIRRLLRFLKNKDDVLHVLIEKGYRIYLESYRVIGGVTGYIYHVDEALSASTVRAIRDLVENKVKLMPAQKWGSGLGIYKRLWRIDEIPAYNTALNRIKETLTKDKLIVFQKIFY